MPPSTSPTTDAQHVWREVARAELSKRPVTERVADFLETYLTLDETTAREQAMRCVQCPNPVCVEACPLGNRVPDWLALTAEGQFLEGAQLLQSSSCLGEVFTRLCHEPCEASCPVGGPGEPVAINAVERFLHQYAADHAPERSARPAPNGYRVAVLDAGPCGLACAHDLARQGYAVTVFDEHLVPGGLLVNGTPAFKLEPSMVERRVAHLRQLGVGFRLGIKLGTDLALAELRAKFDAVFLGACAEQARPLTVPGAHLRGVFQGITFLVQRNAGITLELPPIDVRNRRVLVLGVGDTGLDCLRTAIRAGAREALALHRGGEPDLPARRREYAEAVEEGARFEFFTEPAAVLGDEAGNVIAVRCRRLGRGETSAVSAPREEAVTGSESTLPADVVLIAFGFAAAPFIASGDFARLSASPEGRILVDANLMTDVPGVFAGGSLVRGDCRAVESVRDARQAARAIQRYLESLKTTTC
jgi:glutamate synthase (NADPH/NADH) small chain